ncbi:hypothetical protein GP486_002296 [Trichoglossum hirsutum]|uniref:Inositol-phosphate phosphatase n=1 Tax=Trichoglossum hirsutum TaxID=265104 RepID=A0A9P8LF98_9PEZI|nr:hypothetical protein GP486_002296 [Trichoglossum hirsutum]
MAQQNLKEIHDSLVALAKKAGDLVMTAAPSATTSDTKVNSVDLVTETDVAVEKLVADTLREKYPDYNIRGQGSYRNLTTRLPLNPSPEPLTGLDKALAAVEWGQDRSGPNYEVKWRTFLKLVSAKELDGAMVHGQRMFGSAALNLCAVAAGQLDVYWEGGPWAWDFAAGKLILEEAGGMFVGGNPGDWEPALDGRTVLAVRGAPSGQKQLIEEFWSYVVGRFAYPS